MSIHFNFSPHGIPPGTADFYQSSQFNQNELGFLATMVSIQQQVAHNAQLALNESMQDPRDGPSTIFDIKS